MLPGLPSSPKNVGLLLSAWLKLTRRDARPSRPTMGLLELTCITCAVFSAVICSSPFASRSTNDQTHSYVIPSGKKRSHDLRTVYSVRLTSITREKTLPEHVEAGHAQSLRPAKRLARSFVAVRPVVASSGIEEHRDQEKVEQALGLLFEVRRRF